MNTAIKAEIYELVEKANVALISSVDKNGYPQTKGMLALGRDGMGVHYFSTNCSARRTRQFRNNSHACIYFYREPDYRGVMLVGDIEVCDDKAHRELLWREGFEVYYPQGVDDPDYCVLKFTVKWGNYYHALHNEDFDIGILL